MILTLALASSLVLAQADVSTDAPSSEATADSSVSTSSTAPITPFAQVNQPNVGKGHWNFGTSGGFFAMTGGTPRFSLNGSGNVGYFLDDQVLVGVGLGVGTGISTGTNATGSVGFSFGAGLQYWLPLGPSVFGIIGVGATISPTFYFGTGGGTFLSWSAGPHLGAAIFLTDWLALEPRLSLSFSPSVDVSATWGLTWFL